MLMKGIVKYFLEKNEDMEIEFISSYILASLIVGFIACLLATTVFS